MRRRPERRALALGQLQQAHEHGRHPLAVGDASPGDGRQRGRQVELAVHDQSRAHAQDRHGEPERRSVINWRRRIKDGVLPHLEQVAQARHAARVRAERSEVERSEVERALDALRAAGRP